jgi:hypothetical protein
MSRNLDIDRLFLRRKYSSIEYLKKRIVHVHAYTGNSTKTSSVAWFILNLEQTIKPILVFSRGSATSEKLTF